MSTVRRQRAVLRGVRYDETFSIRFSVPMLEKIREVADLSGVTPANLVRLAVSEYLHDNKARIEGRTNA